MTLEEMITMHLKTPCTAFYLGIRKAHRDDPAATEAALAAAGHTLASVESLVPVIDPVALRRPV